MNSSWDTSLLNHEFPREQQLDTTLNRVSKIPVSVLYFVLFLRLPPVTCLRTTANVGTGLRSVLSRVPWTWS